MNDVVSDAFPPEIPPVNGLSFYLPTLSLSVTPAAASPRPVPPRRSAAGSSDIPSRERRLCLFSCLTSPTGDCRKPAVNASWMTQKSKTNGIRL